VGGGGGGDKTWVEVTGMKTFGNCLLYVVDHHILLYVVEHTPL